MLSLSNLGELAKLSKALVLRTSHYDGAGSNLVPIKSALNLIQTKIHYGVPILWIIVFYNNIPINKFQSTLFRRMNADNVQIYEKGNIYITNFKITSVVTD